MREKKKLLAVILSLAMMLTFMPAAVFADTGSGAWLEMDDHGSDVQMNFTNEDDALQAAYRTSEGFIYTRVNSDGLDSVRVVGYNGGGTVINVPESINGHTVSGFSIDPYDPLFGESYDAVKEINLPDSMIYLRAGNICGFSNLESVSGLKSDLNNERYMTLDGVLYKKTDRGLKAFYPAARKNTKWIMEPGTYSAYFDGYPSLEEVTLSDKYTSTSLLSRLPELKTINLSKDNTSFSLMNGVLYTADKKELLRYPPKKEGKTFSLPAGTERIAEDAFKNSAYIESVTLNKELSEIRWGAFESCPNLSSVVLSDSIKRITWGAFDDCEKLRTITFTSKQAPVCDYPKYDFEGLGEAIRAGAEVKYPSDGTGYEEFLNAVRGEVFDEGKFTEIGQDEAKEFTVTQESPAFIKFTPEATRRYNLELSAQGSGDFYIDSYVVDEGYYEEMWDLSVWQDEADSCNFRRHKDDTEYLRIRAGSSNEIDRITVRISDYGPIGLADIPANCDTLEAGVEKKGSVSSEDQVVTYKFMAPATQNDDDQKMQLSASRTPASGEPSTFEVVGVRPEITYTDFDISGETDELSGSEWLSSDTLYYIQVRPGTAGEFSITLSVSEDGGGSSYDSKFGSVPDGSIEQITVNDEKSVETKGEEETFTYEFSPKQSGNYVFLSEGSSDTVGRVLCGKDVVNDVVKENDDSGSGANFKITFYAEAGKTYYLQARLYDAEDSATFTVKLKDYIGEHQHKMVYHAAVAGTKEKPGTIAYYECSVCGNIFSDEAGKNQLNRSEINADYGNLVTGVTFEHKSELTGKAGSAYSMDDSFLEPGNKISLSFDDGTIAEYICAERKYDDGRAPYFGYYRDGIVGESNIRGDISFTVKTDDGKLAEGDNKVDLKVRWGDQTVSTAFNVKGIADSTAHKHTMTKVDEVAATCTADGTKAYWECSGCGRKFSDEAGKTEISKAGKIKPTGHTETDIADVAPTCTDKGSKGGKKCSACGEILEAPQEVAALGHKLTKVAAKEATTDAEGNVEYWTCDTCGKFFSDAEGKTEIDKSKTVIPKKEAPAPVDPQPAQPDTPTQPDPQPEQPDTPAQPDPQPEQPDTPAPVAAVKVGTVQTVSAGTVKVTSVKTKTVAFTKARNKKSVVVPATVKIKGKTYKVTTIKAKAFKGSKIRNVTIGKNIKKISRNAFSGSKATTVTVKTKSLKKASVKGAFRNSKVKTVKVKVGTKKQNKNYVKKYKKIFTKKNAGRKVAVK